jgi:serine/threonine protein phosphatase PrpC
VYNLGDDTDLDDTDWMCEVNGKIVLAFWRAQWQLDTDPHGWHCGLGSTATVCLWQGGGTVLWWAWVGDSEAVIVLPTIGHKQLTTLNHKLHTSKHKD